MQYLGIKIIHLCIWNSIELSILCVYLLNLVALACRVTSGRHF